MFQGEHSAVLWPSLGYNLSLRSLFCQFLSGRFTQVLLYSLAEQETYGCFKETRSATLNIFRTFLFSF